ncbi:MAG TPA: hypothetical protein VLF43_05055 [Candidatus Saccharimonadales bacterium]|nr:hypothetical protein [Candidatus Saccharimonadales bacterium]
MSTAHTAEGLPVANWPDASTEMLHKLSYTRLPGVVIHNSGSDLHTSVDALRPYMPRAISTAPKTPDIAFGANGGLMSPSLHRNDSATKPTPTHIPLTFHYTEEGEAEGWFFRDTRPYDATAPGTEAKDVVDTHSIEPHRFFRSISRAGTLIVFKSSLFLHRFYDVSGNHRSTAYDGTIRVHPSVNLPDPQLRSN